MDVRDHLLALLGSVAIGDELAPGVRLIDASTELGLRLTVESGGAEVHVELSPADTATRHAARTARLLLAYRSGGTSEVAPAVGKALCEQVARAIEPHEDQVLAAVAREAAALGDAGRTREVAVTRVLERAGTSGERFYTLSPYVGCLIGCRFCYAQSRLSALRRFAGLPAVPWGSWVDVRVNAAEVIERELRQAEAWPIKFCPIVSDPYHAIETRYALTRRCLEVIAARPVPPPVLILTRATLITRDVDVLASLPRAWAGMSVPTIDDAAQAHFEPRGATIGDRLATLRTLREAGIRTCAVAQPMLPGPVDELAAALAEVVDSVSIDILRGEEGAGALFDDPRYAHARDEAWQERQSLALRDALEARGVAVWQGELPPELGRVPDSASLELDGST